jgi:hypothetical protein
LSALCAGGGGGIGVGGGFGVTPVAPPNVGVAVDETILRTTEVGAVSAAVSDSGGGGGGIGVGGAAASANVVDVLTSGLTEADDTPPAAEFLNTDGVEEEAAPLGAAAVATLLDGATPPLLRTFVQRRPWKVVIFDAMQTAVVSACGAKLCID